jgi:hypothetical protein
VVVEGGRRIERICGVDDEGIVLWNVEWRGWPCPVHTDDAAGEATIGVDVVDVGDVPPEFGDTCKGMGCNKEKCEEIG